MRGLVFLAILALHCSVALGQDRCGGGHNCISGQAECEGGACVCQSPFQKGVGNFQCYKKNAVAAEIKNDPLLTNFNNQTVQFPFPCRYLVTHVKQELKDNNRDVIGSCEFKIYAFNGKHKGKYFNYGFDVSTIIKYDDGRTVKMSSRNWGKADDGSYQFWKKGTMGEAKENGPWGDDTIYYRDSDNNIKVRIFEIPENRQLVYEFNKCGLRITLVPYDITQRRNQIEIPGMSVAINCAMHPQWYAHNKVMALGPTMDGGHLFEEYKLPGISLKESIFNRGFAGDFEQNQPWSDDGQCSAVSISLGKCNNADRKLAYSSCFWMIDSPRFVRCMDDTKDGRKILKLFKQCVEGLCGDRNGCSRAMNSIRTAGCANVRDIPNLGEYMNGDFCRT